MRTSTSDEWHKKDLEEKFLLIKSISFTWVDQSMRLRQRWGDYGLHFEAVMAAKNRYPQESIWIFEQEAERFIKVAYYRKA